MLTVGELREKLQQFSDDAEVWVQGHTSLIQKPKASRATGTFVYMDAPARDVRREDSGFLASNIVAITVGGGFSGG